MRMLCFACFFFFFFTDPATTEIYTLSLHDALPISGTTSSWRSCAISSSSSNGSRPSRSSLLMNVAIGTSRSRQTSNSLDRKSTRLNSSHGYISYAVFCLKKKKKKKKKKKHRQQKK